MKRRLGLERLEDRRLMAAHTLYVNATDRDIYDLTPAQVDQAFQAAFDDFSRVADVEFVVNSGDSPHITIFDAAITARGRPLRAWPSSDSPG